MHESDVHIVTDQTFQNRPGIADLVGSNHSEFCLFNNPIAN